MRKKDLLLTQLECFFGKKDGNSSVEERPEYPNTGFATL
jgi:hypothetical protein